MNSARSRQRRWRRKNKIITSFLFFAFMSQHTFTDIPNSPQLSRFTTGWDDGGFSFIEQYCTSLSIEALIKHGNWRCVRAMSMGMLTSLHWFFSLDCCKSSPLFYVLDWNYFVSLLFSFFAQDNLKIFFFPHKSFFTLIFFLCNTLIFALFLLAFFHRDFLWIFTQKFVFHFTSSDFSLDSFAAETVLTSSRENARLNSVELKKKTWTSWGDVY